MFLASAHVDLGLAKFVAGKISYSLDIDYNLSHMLWNNDIMYFNHDIMKPCHERLVLLHQSNAIRLTLYYTMPNP